MVFVNAYDRRKLQCGSGHGACFECFAVTLVPLMVFVLVKPFRENSGGNRCDANESPFPVGIFDKFANDKRRKDASRSNPVANFAFDVRWLMRRSPVMFFLLPLSMFGLAGHAESSKEIFVGP
jgi:hypothetical protein